MSLPTDLNTFKTETARLKTIEGIVKTSRVLAPFFKEHMRMNSGEISTYVEWFDKPLRTGFSTLAAAHTAGSNSFTLSPSELWNDYQVIPNVSTISAGSDSIFMVTAYDTVTRVATVTTLAGTDANIANGTKVKIGRHTPIGSNRNGHNEMQFAKSDYNYISNWSHELKVANIASRLNAEAKELSFDSQKLDLMPEVQQDFEFKAFNGIRTAGTGAVQRNNNTHQAGDGSIAGGVIDLGRRRNMYTVDAGSANYSIDTLETDMFELEKRSAFSSDPTDMLYKKGVKEVCAYMNVDTQRNLQNGVGTGIDAETFFNSEEKKSGTYGAYIGSYLADNVLIKPRITEALPEGTIFYETRKDLIDVDVHRFMELQEEEHNGDNTSRYYANTMSVVFKNPWLFGLRTNFAV